MCVYFVVVGNVFNKSFGRWEFLHIYFALSLGGYPFKTASFFCGYLGASATQGRHEGWDTRFGFKPFTLQGEAGGKDSLLIIRCSLSDGIMA